MKKSIIIVIAVVILSLGAMTAVYARDNNNRPYNFCNRGQMVYQNYNGTNNSMIGIMRANGFETMAEAMESRDFDSMNDFMNNMTDEQYNQMIEIMRENGYGNMSGMMRSFGRRGMSNMHNSMMRR